MSELLTQIQKNEAATRAAALAKRAQKMASSYTPRSGYEHLVDSPLGYFLTGLVVVGHLISGSTELLWWRYLLFDSFLAGLVAVLLLELGGFLAMNAFFRMFWVDDRWWRFPAVLSVVYLGLSLFGSVWGGVRAPQVVSDLQGGVHQVSVSAVRDSVQGVYTSDIAVLEEKIAKSKAAEAAFVTSASWKNRINMSNPAVKSKIAGFSKEQAGLLAQLNTLSVQQIAAVDAATAETQASNALQLSASGAEMEARGTHYWVLTVGVLVAMLFVTGIKTFFTAQYLRAQVALGARKASDPVVEVPPSGGGLPIYEEEEEEEEEEETDLIETAGVGQSSSLLEEANRLFDLDISPPKPKMGVLISPPSSGFTPVVLPPLDFFSSHTHFDIIRLLYRRNSGANVSVNDIARKTGKSSSLVQKTWRTVRDAAAVYSQAS